MVFWSIGLWILFQSYKIASNTTVSDDSSLWDVMEHIATDCYLHLMLSCVGWMSIRLCVFFLLGISENGQLWFGAYVSDCSKKDAMAFPPKQISLGFLYLRQSFSLFFSFSIQTNSGYAIPIFKRTNIYTDHEIRKSGKNAMEMRLLSMTIIITTKRLKLICRKREKSRAVLSRVLSIGKLTSSCCLFVCSSFLYSISLLCIL